MSLCGGLHLGTYGRGHQKRIFRGPCAMVQELVIRWSIHGAFHWYEGCLEKLLLALYDRNDMYMPSVLQLYCYTLG